MSASIRMLDPKFLVVQYAPGSAGKFLMSLLMSSNSVAHFNPDIENNKTLENCMTYFRSHFVNNLGNWLKTEPNHTMAWKLHFYSTKFKRGHDLSHDQFISLSREYASEYFLSCVSNNKIIPTPWHKTYIPAFFQGARFVTVIVDNKSHKWYNRALWNKLYGMKDGKIHLKQDDPEFYPEPMQLYMKKFNNQKYSNESFISFAKKEIVKNSFKLEFSSELNFDPYKNRSFVNLSDLLNEDSCVNSINRICENLDLPNIDQELIRAGHRHWSGCHQFKYAQ